MRRIGHVLHVGRSQNIILKAENAPRIGDKVLDENLKPVGTVFDVFGPTSSPYVAVKPTMQNPQLLVNRVLYVAPPIPGRKEWKKKR